MPLTVGPSTNRNLLLPLPSAPTTPTALPECCPDHSNQHSLFRPDEVPTQSQLRRLADYPLYDSSGHQHPFNSLFSPSCLRKQRLLVIFIRNFFCGNCQQYLLTLAEQLPPASVPSDVAVAVIGCGAPSLLPSYMELTHCPYPLYTDPTAQLYDKLGMQRSWSLGARAPQYIQQSLFLGGLKSIAQGLRRLPAGDVTKAGEMDQNGGEFLFVRTGDDGFWTEDWQVEWCHRMRNTRDHTEISQLRQVLGLRATSGPGAKESQTLAPRMQKERHGKRWNKRSLSGLSAFELEKDPPKPSGHKRSATLGRSLTQKGQTMIRTLSLKRPGTAGSWVKDDVPQKRSLTPALAMPAPSQLTRTTTKPTPSRHARSQSKSKTTAHILNLKVLGGRKMADDSVSESHVALVQVVSPGAVSFRSMTPQIGSPGGTPLLGSRNVRGRGAVSVSVH